MPVGYEVVLVPDMFGSRCCNDCNGYGWVYGYHDDGEPGRIDCSPCEGGGWFREETNIIPAVNGHPLQSSELSHDDYGRHVHRACNGGGVRFFVQCGLSYWSCTSCARWGVLSQPEWMNLQTEGKQPNLLANARGAEFLLELRSSL